MVMGKLGHIVPFFVFILLCSCISIEGERPEYKTKWIYDSYLSSAADIYRENNYFKVMYLADKWMGGDDELRKELESGVLADFEVDFKQGESIVFRNRKSGLAIYVIGYNGKRLSQTGSKWTLGKVAVEYADGVWKYVSSDEVPLVVTRVEEKSNSLIVRSSGYGFVNGSDSTGVNVDFADVMMPSGILDNRNAIMVLGNIEIDLSAYGRGTAQVNVSGPGDLSITYRGITETWTNPDYRKLQSEGL